MPHPGKFPSAAGGRGFKPLADYVHGLGLKLGIHIMRGERIAAVDVPLARLGLAGSLRVRDLWARSERGEASGSVRAEVAAHGAALLKLTPTR